MSKPIRFKMRDGSIHVGNLVKVKSGNFYIEDILDEEVTLKRENIEEITGVGNGFNYKDYPPKDV